VDETVVMRSAVEQSRDRYPTTGWRTPLSLAMNLIYKNGFHPSRDTTLAWASAMDADFEGALKILE
jgi:hypothetical protein